MMWSRHEHGAEEGNDQVHKAQLDNINYILMGFSPWCTVGSPGLTRSPEKITAPCIACTGHSQRSKGLIEQS